MMDGVWRDSRRHRQRRWVPRLVGLLAAVGAAIGVWVQTSGFVIPHGGPPSFEALLASVVLDYREVLRAHAFILTREVFEQAGWVACFAMVVTGILDLLLLVFEAIALALLATIELLVRYGSAWLVYQGAESAPTLLRVVSAGLFGLLVGLLAWRVAEALRRRHHTRRGRRPTRGNSRGSRGEA